MLLRLQAVKGAKWNALGSLITIGIQFAQLFILARILSPEAFGLMAIIQIYIGLVQVFMDAGMNSAIIHKQSLSQEALSSLYWLQVFIGIVLGAFFFAVGPWIAVFYGEPFLGEMASGVSIVFCITPLGKQFELLLQKNLAFKRLALIDIGAALVGIAMAVGFALKGKGALCLVFGFLATQAVRTALLLYNGWPAWRPSLGGAGLRHLKGLWSFGIYQISERCMCYLFSILDRFIIGYFLGSQVLGYYHVAWSLTIQPVTKLSPIVVRVAFPVFAKVQNDIRKLHEGYTTLLKVLSFLNFPLLGGLAVIAPYAVPLFLGDSWTPAILLVQILCFAALFRAIACPMQSLVLALGKVRLLFIWTCLFGFVQTANTILGAYLGGLAGITLATFINSFLNLNLGLFFIIRSLLKVKVRSLYLAFSPALIMTLGMTLSLILVNRIIYDFRDEIIIGILVGIGGLSYGLVGALFFSKDINQILNTAKQD